MKRTFTSQIIKDLPKKIVLLTGPRQCGKTTLSKQLYPNDFDYFNYDAEEDRLRIKEKRWDRNKTLIIFDELHKMPHWKQWIKGVYDTEGIPPEYLVTGSAQLDTYRKVGDSLAGRYFQYRLHPLDLKEIVTHTSMTADKAFEQLWDCSGFPEPFLKGDPRYYKRWRRTHLDIILRQDLLSLYSVSDIKAIEILVSLLKKRIGNSVSYENLARDLERDAKTIKRWLQLLENLYVIFRVTPYSKKISRSLLKEPKYYFYDHTYADNNHGPRLENLVACALLKALQYIEDTTGQETSLHYLRTKDGREMDFLICIEENPTHIIEVKHSDDQPSKHFAYFTQYYPNIEKIQLVKTLRRESSTPSGIKIRRLVDWLADIALQ